MAFPTGGDAGAVKRAGLRTQWLSAYAGSSPVPRIEGKKWTKRQQIWY